MGGSIPSPANASTANTTLHLELTGIMMAITATWPVRLAAVEHAVRLRTSPAVAPPFRHAPFTDGPTALIAVTQTFLRRGPTARRALSAQPPITAAPRLSTAGPLARPLPARRRGAIPPRFGARLNGVLARVLIDERQEYLHISNPSADGEFNCFFASWAQAVQMLLPRLPFVHAVQSSFSTRWRCHPFIFHPVQHGADLSSVHLVGVSMRVAC